MCVLYIGPCENSTISCSGGVCSCLTGYTGPDCCDCATGYYKSTNGTCYRTLSSVTVLCKVSQEAFSIFEISQQPSTSGKLHIGSYSYYYIL